MTEQSTRIEQFRKMAEADPDNELGHYSLGKEYLDARMPTEAAISLRRAIKLNPNLAKAHLFLGKAMQQLQQQDAAIARFLEGARVADERGDLPTRNEIVAALKELGGPIPLFKSPQATRPLGVGEVLCCRCGQPGQRLAAPPFRNALGERIQKQVCGSCWGEWIAMGTKVINELRLPLADPAAQKVFDQHMFEFLNLQSE